MPIRYLWLASIVLLAAGSIFVLLLRDDAPESDGFADSLSGDGGRAEPGQLSSESTSADPTLTGRPGAPAETMPTGRTHPSADASTDAQVGQRPTQPGPGRIVGRVLGPDGKPRKGILLVVEDRDAPAAPKGLPRAAMSCKSDENGWFAVRGIGSGHYIVALGTPGYAPHEQVARGGADVTIRLEVLVPLAGRVVERDTGEAVVHLQLAARHADHPRARQYRTRTGEDGSFAIQVPEGAPYVILVGHGYGSGDVLAWIRQTAGPFDAGREDLLLEARRGLEIAGEIRDRAGAFVTRRIPVAAVLIARDGHPDPSHRRFGYSAMDGTFRLRGLPPGRYTLTLEPKPPAADSTEVFLATRTIDGVQAGTVDLVVELSGGEPIHGTLVDEQGEPVTRKGYVLVKPHGTRMGSPEMVHATLDGKGGFVSPPLDPATAYEIAANGFAGYMQLRMTGVHPGTAPVTLTLKTAASISGRVVDEGGLPVPAGVGVMAAAIGIEPGSPGFRMFGYTRAGGDFTLDGLGPHTFMVSAGGAASPYISAESVGSVKTGTIDLILRVKRGVLLSGRLVDSAGEPVKTNYLAARLKAGGAGPYNWTRVEADDGSFRFPGVRPGRIVLAARIGDDVVTIGEVDAPGEDVVVTVPDR